MVLVVDGVIVNAFSISACCAAVRSSSVVPPAFVATTDLVVSVAVGRSVRSRSANAMEPASLSADVIDGALRVICSPSCV